MLDYKIALGITRYLAREEHYIPFSTALDSLGYIKSMLERTVAYGDFKVTSRAIFNQCSAMKKS